MFEPLIKLALSKLDPLIDRYIEQQRIILMIAAPGTLLFLLLFWAFSGAGGLMLVLALLLVAAEAVLAGGIFLLDAKYREEIREWNSAADAIEAFLTGSDVFSEWTQFLNTAQEDRRLEQLRINCNNLPKEYPPEAGENYCGQEGLDLLEVYVSQLRAGVATKASEDFSKWWVVWRAGRDERKARREDRKAKKEARKDAKARARAEAMADEEPADEVAAPMEREETPPAPVRPLPSLAEEEIEEDTEPVRPRRVTKKVAKKAKTAKKQANKTAKKAAKKAAKTAKRSAGKKPAPKGRRGRPARDPGVGMVTEAAAIQEIMDAGFTAHDFDRKQEQILKQRGRVPSPAEVARGLMADQKMMAKGKRPSGKRVKSPRRVKVRQGDAGGVHWMRFVFFLGVIGGSPFAVWRIPQYDSKPAAIVGEVLHEVLDQPTDIRHQLRTPFEELVFKNRAVNLVDGRRIYVSEADYKLCWPDPWEVIYEKNYTVRITAEARPLYFDDFTVAKITMVSRVDSPMARAD
ncbi:MAG: hypothetical protein ACYSU7_07705 [Planctomycetota bacterium]